MAAALAQSFGPERAEELRFSTQVAGSSIQSQLSELSSALEHAKEMPQNILVKADFALASAVATYLAQGIAKKMTARRAEHSAELARATADLISPNLTVALSSSGPVKVAAALRASAGRIEKTVPVSKKA
jgi:hypothetical protein